MTITIDGPAGAGKSTVARELARRLEFDYLDSGAMYRAAAWLAIDATLDPEDGPAVAELVERVELTVNPDPDDFVGGYSNDISIVPDELRTAEVSAASSKVAAQPALRQVLVARQRAICAGGDWVVEGRDMGTAVFPDSVCKIYLDADPAVRAARRADEGSAESEAAIAERDARDIGRSMDPLRPADDAMVIDTTHLELAEVLNQCEALVTERRASQE